MRSVIFIALIFVGVTVASKPSPFDKVRNKFDALDDNTKKYFCELCTDTVVATEEFIGAEGEDGLDRVIADCVSAISKGTPIGFAQFICDTLFGDNVRPIIKQLNDPAFRAAEAAKVCGQITACPSVYPQEANVVEEPVKELLPAFFKSFGNLKV